MSVRLRLLPRRDADPGEAWTEALLEPLREEEIACDIAPSVMARVAAERVAVRPLPAILARPRLLWAACVPAGIASLAFLTIICLGLRRAGSGGAAPGGALAALLSRLIRLLGERLAAAAGFVVTVVAPLLRAAWALVETLAPLLRGAGLVAATTGLLSIIISVYIFNHSRGTAPQAGAASGILPHGGTR